MRATCLVPLPDTSILFSCQTMWQEQKRSVMQPNYGEKGRGETEREGTGSNLYLGDAE